MSRDRNAITRDGFASEYGRFFTVDGRVERVDGASLRRMFLPKLTPEGQKILRERHNFVRGQLKHYAVPFDERQFSGNGTLLMKKFLQAGRCDAVPAHILALQEQMHREWLQKLTPEEMSDDPDWVMEAYFLQAGSHQPDPTRTTTVVGVPFPPSSQDRAGQMRDAASKVAGLYHETGRGPETQTVFMGWDAAAVEAAARGHAAKEKKELQAKEQKREAERAAMHTDYLQTLKRKSGSAARKPKSPVGSYLVDCEYIEEEWPDRAEDLRLDIHDTESPGIFQACFDFGVLEGVMIIGTEQTTLEQYCLQADRESRRDWGGDDWDGDDSDEDDWDVEGGERLKVGSKRKAPGPQRSSGSKKSKAGERQSRTYHLKSRCRETGRVRFIVGRMMAPSNSKMGASPPLWETPLFPSSAIDYLLLRGRFLMCHVHRGANGLITPRNNMRLNELLDGTEIASVSGLTPGPIVFL